MHTVFPQRNSREGDYCSLLGTRFTEGEYLNLLNLERLQNEDERIRFPSLTSWSEPNSAQILDLTNRYPPTADRLEPDERGRNQITTPSGNQETWIINESGLYNVLRRR